MDINLGQKKIYYNVDVQKDKLYSNLKNSFINLCTYCTSKKVGILKIESTQNSKHGIKAGHHIQVVHKRFRTVTVAIKI